jgi:O-antigen/teichoic acid export membrane protein
MIPPSRAYEKQSPSSLSGESRRRRGFSIARRFLSADTTTVVGIVVLLNLLRIVSTIVLTRLLNAEAYGVIGIVTSIAVVFALISDIGVVAFVVRHEQGLDSRLLDKIWTIRLVRSAVLTVAMAVLAGPISQFMQKPELFWPLVFGSLTFLLDGLGSMSIATALRQNLVKRLSVIDLIASLFVFVISVSLAWWWGNFWAVLVTSSLGQCLRAVLSYIWFPDSARRLRFSRARFLELWRFARYITGSTIITLFLTQADKLVLSRLFTLETLGLYVLASNLATAAVGLAAAYCTRVLYPNLARQWRESPSTFREAFYHQRMLMSSLYIFAVGGTIGSADLIVAVLYDERYYSASVFFQLLSVSALFSLNNYAINELTIASGRQYFTFRANVVRLLYLGIFAYPAYRWFGPVGAIAVVGSTELVAQLYGWSTLHRLRLLDWRRELSLLGLGGVGVATGLGVNAVGLRLLH